MSDIANNIIYKIFVTFVLIVIGIAAFKMERRRCKKYKKDLEKKIEESHEQSKT